MDIQSVASIIFLVLLAFILYFNRNKLQIQKVLGPFLYVLMYKTQAGISIMDKVAKKIPRTIQYLGFAGVFFGFLGMALVSYSLIQSLYQILFVPSAPASVALVLPFKMKGTFFVPFFYWIISIFLLVIVHEFSHGVVSRAYHLKIKSSGLAFLGVLIPIIPAAFVEPDEKELKKRPAKQQLSIFAAGSFSNFLFAALAILFMVVALNPIIDSAVDYSGVEVTGLLQGKDNLTLGAEAAGISAGEVIINLDGTEITTVSNISAILGQKSPGDQLNITTNSSEYLITLSGNPQNISMAFLGIQLKQRTEMNPEFEKRYGAATFSVFMWFAGLIMWLYILNLGIGLFNLLPIPITDGGRMFYIAIISIFEEKKANLIWKFTSIFFIVVLLMSLGMGFVK